MKTDKDTPKGLPGHKDSLRIEGHAEPARLNAPQESGEATDPILAAATERTPGAVKWLGAIMALLGIAAIVMLFVGYRHHSTADRHMAVAERTIPRHKLLKRGTPAFDAMMNAQDYTTYGFSASPKQASDVLKNRTVNGIYDPTTGMVYLFRTDNADVDENAALSDFARKAADAGYNVEIRAYTDPRGRADYNRRLSERRARAVGDYMCRHGLSPMQVKAKGMGATDAYGSHAQDRRAEIRVVR